MGDLWNISDLGYYFSLSALKNSSRREWVLGMLPFFLEYTECRNKALKNLPHPEAQVRGCGGQQQVDRVANLAFEEVAILSKVALEVPDPIFTLERCLPGIQRSLEGRGLISATGFP